MSRLYDALTAIEHRAPRVLPQTDLPRLPSVSSPSRRWWAVVFGGVVVLAGVGVGGVMLMAPAARQPASPRAAVRPPPALAPAVVSPAVSIADIRQRAHEAAGRGALAEAEGLLDRALALLPTDVAVWNDLGVIRVRRGQVRRAIEAFERGLALQPTSAEIHRNLAVALDKDGQTAAATKHYRTFLTLAPHHPDRVLVERRLATPPAPSPK